MATQAYILTNTGIHATTTDFSSFSTTGIIGDIGTGCITHDARMPMFWAFHPLIDQTAWQWAMFNPATGANVPGTEVDGWKYVRAAQYDQMTGNALFLVPFKGTADAGGPYGSITRRSQSTGLATSFPLMLGESEMKIFYALDMKIDPTRRRLWVLDSGNQRIVRANLDTGSIERIFSSTELVTPCSMAIDLTTGKAYVRALNAPAPNENDSSSSSSQSSSSGSMTYPIEGDFRETIYVIDDDEMSPLVDVWSGIEYPDWALQPTSADTDLAIAGEWAILPPKSDTVKFDPMRRRLWWASKREERILFTFSIDDGVMESVSLGSRMDFLDTIAIDHNTGGIVACGSKGANGVLVTMDMTCSEIASHSHSMSASVNNVMIMAPEFGNSMPFYAVAVAASIAQSSSSSESSEDLANPTQIDNSLIADPMVEEDPAESSSSSASSTGESSIEGYQQDGVVVTTSSPMVTVTTWGRENKGVMATSVWSAKGRPLEPIDVSSAVSTPLFSWNVVAVYGSPCVAIVTAADNLIKMAYDPDTASLDEVSRCSLPVGGAIDGLSVANGDGNVYVSGNGEVVKVNFDPTTPGDSTLGTMSSSSSSSWSMDEKPASGEELPVSEKVVETGVGGVSVQFHDKPMPACAVSGQEGKLILFDSISRWDDRVEFGPLPSPFKAVWSKRHAGAIVACRKSVQLVAVPGGLTRQLYGVPYGEVTDVCCLGSDVGITVASSGREDGLFKVLASDLSTNRLLYRTTGEFPSKATFSATGKAVVALERVVDGKAKTRFVAVTIGSEPSQPSDDIEGSVASLFLDGNFGIVFALFSSGTIVVVSDYSGICSVTRVGNIPEGIKEAKGSLVDGVSSVTARQRKARVFVGSREGSSDRWDSGEIDTSAGEMLYGGGGNLEPGEAYWVSVSVMDRSKGWSTPSSRRFVVPIM